MTNCVITFRSVTPAQRAEQLLIRYGYACTLGRTPRWMQEQGCGYSLRLSCEDVKSATMLLRQQEIPYRKAYLQRDGGRPEELML